MATNYTFAQVCEIINNGTNTEALVDIGKRFPLLMHKVSQVTAIAGDKFVDLMKVMPDYVTAKKVDAALKTGPSIGDTVPEDEAAEAETETTTEATEEVEEETASSDNYDNMTASEIWKLMCERGLDKIVKSKKKGDRIEALRKYDAEHSGETTEDAEEEATEESNPYDGKSAPDLYKECKKRGIKAQPKKPAKYYVDLLLKADAEQATAEANAEESDNWDDEDEAEEEAPKAKKSGKKEAPKAKKEAPKAGKKAAKNEDEDDDWDI